MATTKTPIWQRQKKIDQLEKENERLEHMNGLLRKDLEKVYAGVEKYDAALGDALRRNNLLFERLEEENMSYAEKQGVFDAERKDRYNALGECLKSVAAELSEKGEVCELKEIKSGDVFDEKGKGGDSFRLGVFFKGSTPAGIWNYSDEIEKLGPKEMPRCNRFNSELRNHKEEISYGEILDPARLSSHHHVAGYDTDYVFYDGAHYFVLYFENVNNINVGNIVRSHLQQYGLGLKETYVQYLDFRKKRCQMNEMEEYIKLNNQRIRAIRDLGR